MNETNISIDKLEFLRELALAATTEYDKAIVCKATHFLYEIFRADFEFSLGSTTVDEFEWKKISEVCWDIFTILGYSDTSDVEMQM